MNYSKQIKITIAMLIGITFFANCKKENSEECPNGKTNIIQQYSLDTIFPSDYIMAYPGSWWEYDNGKVDSCRGYFTQKIENIERNYPCLSVYEDLIYVPTITSLGAIYKGSIIKITSNYQGTKFVEMIDTAKSNSIVSYGKNPYPSNYNHYSQTMIVKSEIIEHLSSFQVNGIIYADVIHCQTSEKTDDFKLETPPPRISHYYFAKNIGLIEHSSSYVGLDTRKRLINHYIAPH
ncbi:MAG: hypothetical protein ABF242_04585 [Flavobacteriales bacterium]